MKLQQSDRGLQTTASQVPSHGKMVEILCGIERSVQIGMPHPFSEGITRDNAESVCAHFLAISLGFPYAQAAAQGALLDEFLSINQAPRPEVELTTVVANFLCWDETGGHWQVLKHGNVGLPFALETDKHFHGNLLKRDIERIFGYPIDPDFSITGPYLKDLQKHLSSLDDVWRCATMVSFERHAELVITALWNRLSDLFDIDKDALDYFTTHVGGDDAAEVYHVQMTERMIDRIVPENAVNRFLTAFDTAFDLHIGWSSAICRRV